MKYFNPIAFTMGVIIAMVVMGGGFLVTKPNEPTPIGEYLDVYESYGYHYDEENEIYTLSTATYAIGWEKFYKINDTVDGYIKVDGKWVEKKYTFLYSDFDIYNEIRKEVETKVTGEAEE